MKQNFIKNFQDNAIDGAALADIDNDDLAGNIIKYSKDFCLKRFLFWYFEIKGMGIKKEENQQKLLKSIRKLFQEARPKTMAL